MSDPLHLEFTEETIVLIKSTHETKVVIVENYCLPQLRQDLVSLANRCSCDLVQNPGGNRLSASWNMIIRAGIDGGFDYILVSNNDLIFHPRCLDNLVAFAEEHPDFLMWTAAEWKGQTDIENREVIRTKMVDVSIGDGFDGHPHFSCYMVKNDFQKRLVEKEVGTKEPFPGLFDENYAPAYFEDGDMHQRILRFGSVASKTATALFYHYGSRTIKIDSDLDARNKDTYEKNRNYFKTKWGFDPHGQVWDNSAKERFAYKGPFEPN